jgi:hypothetical protein
MKRIIVGIVLVFLALPAAQAQDETWLELLRADIRADRTAIFTAAMELTDDQGTMFWPIYRGYEVSLSAINDQRIQLIKDYAKVYDNLAAESAKEIADRWFKMQSDRLKLRKSYYKKFEKALSTGIAARFVQVDHQLGLFGDLQIASEMPLIEVVE